MQLSNLAKLDSSLVLMESQANSKLLGLLQLAASNLKIPIYIIGGMALAAYGYSRFTNDVDVLVNKQDTDQLANWLMSKGFKSIGNNKLSDGQMIANICYPGLKAGSFAFPNLPGNTSGVNIIELPRLLAMKIEANRYKDRADFVELVKANKLSDDYLKASVIPLVSTVIGRRLALTLWRKAQKELNSGQ